MIHTLHYGEGASKDAAFRHTVRLYDYQEETLQELAQAEEAGHKNIMLELPTGCGKTVVAGAFTEDKLKKGKRVLFLANRDILVGQAIEKFQLKLGIYPLREQASQRAYTRFGSGGLDNNCVAGSVQTMHDMGRLENWSPDSFDYILSDEAHRCTGNGWRGIRSYFKNAVHIGLSATPRAAIEAGLFQKSIKPITLAQAVERGFLVDCHIHRVKTDIDLSSIGLSGSGAEKDFNKKQLDEVIFKHTSMLATSIKKKIGGMRTAVFAPSVASAQGLAHALNDLGVTAESVSYKSPDPVAVIERFKNKEFQVIVNCLILCEGWDDGDVESIVICNPSVNRDRYVQIVGRVLRLPETIEKKKGIVFDYAGVSDKHDLMHAVDVFIDGDQSDPYNVELRKRARQLVDSGAETDGLKAVQQAKKEMAEMVANDPSKRRKAEEIHTEEKVVVFDPIYARVLGMPTQMPAKQLEQKPATQQQKDFITRVSKGKLPTEGLTSEAATRVIIDLKKRMKEGKCLPAQLNLLRILNCPIEKRLTMTTAEANKWITDAPKPEWWGKK